MDHNAAHQSRRRSVSSASTTDSTLSSTSTSNGKNMIVAVRVRPLSAKELSLSQTVCCEVVNEDSGVVSIRRGGDTSAYLKSQAGSLTEYIFDEVFGPESTQNEVYDRTTKPFIPKAIDGFNVTVFAYGATSAGKTHTMFGDTRADEAASNADAGIIPNAVADVFRHIREREETTVGETWGVTVSFIEVYNESILDLLNPNEKGLSLREDQEKGIVVVAGATEQRVTSLEGVMDCLMEGSKNRKTESTNANQTSSRSHAVLQLAISHTFRSPVTGREVTQESKLSLIDLAGSERASATTNNGARLQEGASINKSLLALANCINALAENQTNAHGKKVNVKFRDSKLTLLLKNSLEGKSHLVMICNICPSHITYEDSHNTLKYANRAKNIKVNPALKETTKEGSTWAEREVRLLEENARLRERVRYLEQLVSDLRAGRAASEEVTVESAVGMGELVEERSAGEGLEGSEGSESLEQCAEQGAKQSARHTSKQSTSSAGKRRRHECDVCADAIAEESSGACTSSHSSSAECNGPCAAVDMGTAESMVVASTVDDAQAAPTNDADLAEVRVSKRLRHESATADDEVLPPPPPVVTAAAAELANESESIVAPRDLKALRRRRQSAIPMPSRRASLLPSDEPAVSASLADAPIAEVDKEVDLGGVLGGVLDEPVVFDLGCADEAPLPPRRGRASIAVGSRLATNRRKSMVAISAMLDNLSSMGVPAATALEAEEDDSKGTRKGRRGLAAQAISDEENAPPPNGGSPAPAIETETRKIQTRRTSLMVKPIRNVGIRNEA